jgi:hypothetical protein
MKIRTISKFIKQSHLIYPLMRDPKRNPKCYELTDTERLAAVELADKLLKEQEHADQYWGA